MANVLPDIRDLWNYNQPQQSREKFKKLIQTYSHHDEYVLILKTQVARTLGLELKFQEAHKLLAQVQESLKPNQKRATAWYFIEKGRVYNSHHKKSDAIQNFLQAFKFSQEIQHEHLIVDSAHMLAIASVNFEDQKKWTKIAIEEAGQATDLRVRDWKGSLLNNWGWSLFEQKEYKAALKVFKEALKFRETKSSTEAILIAKWTVARTYRAINEIDSALKIQTTLLKDWENLGKKDGYVYEELGELYLVKKEDKKRKRYFQLAFQELSKDPWFVKNKSQRLERIKTLAQF